MVNNKKIINKFMKIINFNYFLAAIILFVTIILDDEFLKLILLTSLSMIYLIKRYDSKILIKFGLLFIIFSAIGHIIIDDMVANQIIIYSYYILVIGTIQQFLEYIREIIYEHKK